MKIHNKSAMGLNKYKRELKSFIESSFLYTKYRFRYLNNKYKAHKKTGNSHILNV
jgi:hypothetical protein